jgi:hypothetical protein
VRTQRGLVDYALRRRALLRDVKSGRVPLSEVCDASPYLLQAAKFHGVASETMCPVCRREQLVHVHWVYGAQLRTEAGSARTPAELERLADAISEFTVHLVEVCRTCSWNHLVSSFVMGHGRELEPPARDRRRSRA